MSTTFYCFKSWRRSSDTTDKVPVTVDPTLKCSNRNQNCKPEGRHLDCFCGPQPVRRETFGLPTPRRWLVAQWANQALVRPPHPNTSHCNRFEEAVFFVSIFALSNHFRTSQRDLFKGKSRSLSCFKPLRWFIITLKITTILTIAVIWPLPVSPASSGTILRLVSLALSRDFLAISHFLSLHFSLSELPSLLFPLDTRLFCNQPSLPFTYTVTL